MKVGIATYLFVAAEIWTHCLNSLRFYMLKVFTSPFDHQFYSSETIPSFFFFQTKFFFMLTCLKCCPRCACNCMGFFIQELVKCLDVCVFFFCMIFSTYLGTRWQQQGGSNCSQRLLKRRSLCQSMVQHITNSCWRTTSNTFRSHQLWRNVTSCPSNCSTLVFLAFLVVMSHSGRSLIVSSICGKTGAI